MAAEPQMIYRTLGATGERVSAIGIGGFHIGEIKDEAESIKVVRSAVDRGITFMDNCWDYHDGLSEQRMGKALRDGYRDRVFLMTKIDGRTRDAAMGQLETSLKRLQTDHVDLLQVHEVIRMNDPERVFAPGGTMEALLEAKKQGKIRYIGFTGHKSPQIHLHMLNVADANGFKFDTVQMPINVMDAHFDSFTRLVLPVLVEKNIGVLGMKPIAAGKIIESKTVSAIDCLHYAMSMPTSVVITGCDSMKILDQALEAAKTFKPLSEEQRNAILAKTAEAAKNGQFEEYKTTHMHDSTMVHPDYLEVA